MEAYGKSTKSSKLRLGMSNLHRNRQNSAGEYPVDGRKYSVTTDSIRNCLKEAGWVQIGETDHWHHNVGYTFNITMDETLLIKNTITANSVAQEGYPIADLVVQDLAKLIQGTKPAGFAVAKPKVGETASLF
jgi:hypothetical protein